MITDGTTTMEIKPGDNWTEEDKSAVREDAKAQNIIFQALEDEIINSVELCNSAKEVWDTLIDMFEGNAQLRKIKLDLVVNKYESFYQPIGEPIAETYERFKTILNELHNNNKEYTWDEYNRKFLWSLSRFWDTKRTTIVEYKNLEDITLPELYGNLKTYEEQVKHRDMLDNVHNPTKTKSLALQEDTSAKALSTNEETAGSESDEEDDDFALFVKFRKFMINQKKGNRINRRQPKSTQEQLCFNCNRPGHFAADCKKPKKRRDERKSKNYPPTSSKKKVFIANNESWSDTDNDEQSDDDQCLMAITEGQSSKKVTSKQYFDFTGASLEELRETLHEVMDDANELSKQFKVLSCERDRLSKTVDEQKLKIENMKEIQNKLEIAIL